MNPVFHINPDLDIPLYRQLVDMMQSAIKKGQLTSGQKLPTVQEMAETLSISRGTIKRAYDELERMGLLEKVQGRGTFVCFQPVDSGSRKEQAMAAIDTMLNQMEMMGLSPAEINIFLNLKLRERAEQEAKVKVIAVACNSENLDHMAWQLRQIEGIDLYTYLLETVQKYPYQLGDDFDLLVTTSSHVDYLQGFFPGKKRISQVALRLSAEPLSQIIRLPSGCRIGILSYSLRFGELLQEACLQFAESAIVKAPLQYSQNMDLEAYLKDVDVLLIPEAAEKYFGSQSVEIRNCFSGKIVPCFYEMDDGSMLYLESKIRRLLDAKSL